MNITSDENSEFDEDSALVEGSSSYTSLSPYLSFDPAYLPAQPEYLFPYGPKRGWFEYAFYNIGTACIVGAAIGGCRGFYEGLNLTTLAGQTGRIQRTRILNHVIKQGAATSNTLGTIAFMYCNLGVLLSLFRNADDELNSITAATLTGMLYRVQGGIRKCGIGGATGFGLASLYYLCTSYDKLLVVKDHFRLQYAPTPQDTSSDYVDE